MSGLAFAAGRPWPQLLKSVLDQLDPTADPAVLGLVFLADPTTEMADLVLDGLKQRTGITHWLGAASTAVFADGRELASEGAIVVLPLPLPGVGLEPFAGRLPRAAAAASGAIVHLPDAAARLGALASGAMPPMIGGQGASIFDHAQISLTPSAGTPSGTLLRGDVQLVAGISTGLRTLGPGHRVTGGRGHTLFALDGRPAADVLAAEAGDLLLRQPRQLSRQLVAVAADGPFGIGLVDRTRGAVALVDLPPRAALPAQITFARRDPALALDKLADLARDLRRRLEGRTPRAALLYSSIQRGHGFFGPAVDEAAVVAKALGTVPLVGMRTAAEVAGHDQTRYAAALALLG